MKLVNNRFWRLEPAMAADPAAILDSPYLTSPDELIAKLRPLDGIVVAAWDPDREEGQVLGLGIVEHLDKTSAVVDWRRADFALRPCQFRSKSEQVIPVEK